jgi:DNA-binding NarL/FixJ family response regulator
VVFTINQKFMPEEKGSSKTAKPEEILLALKTIRRGHRFRSRALTARCEQMEEAEVCPHLSPREMQTLRLIARGFSSDKIGSRLGVSYKTIETHRSNLLRKLGADSSAQLVYRAIAYGFLELAEASPVGMAELGADLPEAE